MKARGMVVPTDSAAAWTVTFSPARFFLTYIVWYSKFVLSGGIRATELWFENCGHSMFREMLKTPSKRDELGHLNIPFYFKVSVSIKSSSYAVLTFTVNEMGSH